MIIAFKVILLIVISVSFMGSVGEKEDKKLRNDMAYICMISILLMLVMVIWL